MIMPPLLTFYYWLLLPGTMPGLMGCTDQVKGKTINSGSSRIPGAFGGILITLWIATIILCQWLSS